MKNTDFSVLAMLCLFIEIIPLNVNRHKSRLAYLTSVNEVYEIPNKMENILDSYKSVDNMG